MDFSTMKPREVESYLRWEILDLFGNLVEDASSIAAHNGYYSVDIIFGSGRCVFFGNFRKQQVPQIVKAMKALSVK